MRLFVFGAALAAASAAAHGQDLGADQPPAAGNAYPTVAVADYILGCMAANGGTREALERCSCSIDVIATILPYEDYETAEAYLSLARVTGERGALFRETEPSKEATAKLRRAQIEADLRCF